MSDLEVMKPPKTTKVPKRPANAKPTYKCKECDTTVTQEWKLTSHVREFHCKTKPKIPHAITKNVNDVWYETVLGTDRIMEITKSSENLLKMRPLPVKPDVIKKEKEDKSHPTSPPRFREEPRKLSGKMKRKLEMKNENLRKHKCNTCKMTFKRSCAYMHHITSTKHK